MSDQAIDLPHLRTLIGLRVRYFGEACTIVEVLDEPPTLVLEAISGQPTIQSDAHGRASEFGRGTLLIRVLSPDRLCLGDDLLHLELLD